MAAFTTMALLGLGLLGGKVASDVARRRTPPPANIGDKGTVGPNDSLLAPGPVAPMAPMAPPAPPDPQVALGTAVGQAQLAAKKARRRASADASGVPAPSGAVATASLQPRTLLGY